MKNTEIYNGISYMEAPGLHFFLHSSKFDLEYIEIWEIFYGSIILYNEFHFCKKQLSIIDKLLSINVLFLNSELKIIL